MAQEKIPVQGGERASIVSGAFFSVKRATLAIVAHSVYVRAASGIGLGGHDSAICVQRHSDDIRNHDPFSGVNK